MAEIFYSTFPGTRPIRCSEATRQLAADALHGKHGQALLQSPCVHMEEVPGFAEMNPRQKYDAMILKIAQEAPVILRDTELLVGSASLSNATWHMVPARFQGELVQTSVSHVTPGFDRLLERGLDNYAARIDRRMETAGTAEERAFLGSLQNVCRAIRIWHTRYLQLLEQRIAAAETPALAQHYRALYDNLKEVPFRAPRHFREALQALWFAFAFCRLCGNWPGIGRIDKMLGGFLESDLRSGVLTLDEARELLAHFFIRGCEWITLCDTVSGDGQYYQNLVLAGVDDDGRPLINEVTRLVLDIVEEFPIGDFPIAVRLLPDAPAWLTRKIAAVQRHGGGVVAVYNENLVRGSLEEFGYTPEQARRYANDGCWEVQIPGETHFAYTPIDAYGILERKVLCLQKPEPMVYTSFEELKTAYFRAMDACIHDFQKNADTFSSDETPSSVIALLTEGCIEHARDYLNGGARYRVCSPHMGAIPDVGNALLAIKKLVFDEKKVNFPTLMRLLQNDWAGAEELRLYAARQYVYYGNDNDEADALVAEIANHFIETVRAVPQRNGILRPPGISTFGRQIDWSPGRFATPFGSHAKTILSGNLNPTPGTDKTGATAIIRSHCKTDLSRLTCGTALDIKLEPTAVEGKEGLDALEGLLSGFLQLGGFFMQTDVMDNAILLEAQQHPEQYPNLTVRISGWSARFITLSREWQQMIIERSAQPG